MLREPRLIAALQPMVRTESFWLDKHQKIHRAMEELAALDGALDEALDLGLLANRLKEQGLIDDTGGPAYLGELWELAPTTRNAKHYAAVVQDNAFRREMIREATAELAEAYNPTGPAVELIAKREKRIHELTVRMNGTSNGTCRLATTCLADVFPEPVRWLVPEYLPLGKMLLFAGDGGHGKTSLTLDLMACVTTGRPCLGLSYDSREPAEALLISCEDDRADTVVPRLLAAGADMSRIFAVNGVETAKGKPGSFSLADYAALEHELQFRPNVRLVVIDPAGAYIGRAGVDDHKDSELRTLLGPLAELAANRQVTILLVKHLNKGASSKAVHKVSGSAGYVNAVRGAYLVTPDPKEESRKLFLPLKFNLGPKPAGLAFMLCPLDSDERIMALDGYTSGLDSQDRNRLAEQLFRISWQGQTEADADDVLSETAKLSRAGARDVDQAAEWLKKFLAKGPVESDQCPTKGNQTLGMSHGVKWWRENILRGRLGGKPMKTGFGDATKWWYCLPGQMPPAATGEARDMGAAHEAVDRLWQAGQEDANRAAQKGTESNGEY
jgi:hypothetical protein